MKLLGAPTLLVHGFNVADGGAGTTDRLRPGLERCGAMVEEADTEWRPGIIRDVLRVRWYSPAVAAQVHRFTTAAPGPGTDWIGIGHSNGCNILWQAAELGAPLRVLVLINPALGRGARFPPQVRRIIVYRSADDIPVWFAWLLHHLSPLNVSHGRHPWGGAGRWGFNYDDPRIVEHEESSVVGASPIAHSDVFREEHLPDFEAHMLAALGQAWHDTRRASARADRLREAADA